jgi:hypothetical protein
LHAVIYVQATLGSGRKSRLLCPLASALFWRKVSFGVENKDADRC